jgi:hypothetical protein
VLAGAEVVVDVANSPSFEDQAAMEFFQTAGRNLTAAEVAAGVRHHVALSVVGTERLQASGYFRAKPTQENYTLADPAPRSSSNSFAVSRSRQRQATQCACPIRYSSRWQPRMSRRLSPRRLSRRL